MMKTSSLLPAPQRLWHMAVAALLSGMTLLAGCASGGSSQANTNASPFGSQSGVQMYGEIDMSYGHTRHKTHIQP